MMYYQVASYYFLPVPFDPGLLEGAHADVVVHHHLNCCFLFHGRSPSIGIAINYPFIISFLDTSSVIGSIVVLLWVELEWLFSTPITRLFLNMFEIYWGHGRAIHTDSIVVVGKVGFVVVWGCGGRIFVYEGRGLGVATLFYVERTKVGLVVAETGGSEEEGRRSCGRVSRALWHVMKEVIVCVYAQRFDRGCVLVFGGVCVGVA